MKVTVSLSSGIWTLAVVLAVLLTAAGCAAPVPMAAPADVMSEEAPIQALDQQAGRANAPEVERKVVANASVDLVVADAEETVERIEELVNQLDGYVSQANLYRGSYSGAELMQGNLTLRVPAHAMSDALSQLELLALTVRSKDIDQQDVTDQYSDIDAQLRNLEATENELRELLAEVRARPNAKPEDILAVHRNLTDVRGQIEQLQGRKNMLDNLVALVTIHVSLTPDAANRPVMEDGWRPTIAARDATRSLVSALQFLGNMAIWMGMFFLPLALLALIPVVISVFVIRAIQRRRGRVAASAAKD